MFAEQNTHVLTSRLACVGMQVKNLSYFISFIKIINRKQVKNLKEDILL